MTVRSRSLYLVFAVIEITLHFVTVKQCLSASIERDLFYPVKKSQIVEKANMVLAEQVYIWKKNTDEKISHEIRLFW